MPSTVSGAPAGTKALVKPRRAASLSRGSMRPTGRIAPDRATSPKNTDPAGNGLVEQGGGKGGGGGEVARRFADAVAAGDAEIDVAHAEAEAAAGVEHGEQHGEAGAIPADDGAARVAGGFRAGEGLHFGEDGARAFHRGEDGAAGGLAPRCRRGTGRRGRARR